MVKLWRGPGELEARTAKVMISGSSSSWRREGQIWLGVDAPNGIEFDIVIALFVSACSV